jgi:hypothetical protein
VSTVQFRPPAPPASPRPSRACGPSKGSRINPKYPQNAQVCPKLCPRELEHNQLQPTAAKVETNFDWLFRSSHRRHRHGSGSSAIPIISDHGPGLAAPTISASRFSIGTALHLPRRASARKCEIALLQTPRLNGACGDEAGASIERGTADSPHHPRAYSGRPAGYGCHTGNSGSCCAAEPLQACVTGKRTGDKLQIPHLVPYSFILPFPSFTLSVKISSHFLGTRNSLDYALSIARKAGVPGSCDRVRIGSMTRRTQSYHYNRRGQVPLVAVYPKSPVVCRHNSVRQQIQAVKPSAGMDSYAINPGP